MSFGIALSGIQAINEALDVTSHNIANAGTYGYKSSRANFSSLVAGDQPTGVNIGSKTQNIGLSGGILNTGRSLDASINGAGFFMVKDSSNTINYTRVGIFDTSKDGFLTDASGRRVQGATITPPSTTPGAQGDITIPTGQIPAVISDKLNYVGNLSADWKVTTFPATVTPTTPPDPSTFSMSKTSIIYDTLGGQHTLTQYFGASAQGKVDVNYVVDGNSIGKTTTLEFNLTSGQMTVPDPTDPAVKGVFDMGDLSGIDTSDAALWPGFTSGAKLTSDFKVDYTGTTYFAGEATTSTNAANGYASGTFAGVDLAKDGSVIAKYSNGQKQAVGKLTLATFPDEGALTQVDDTSWVQSLGSGTPLVNYAGVGTTGTLNTSSLEQSNVDITSELVGLMTSQRNYQANSKVIQTESQMMQSLMQAI
ncbi:flagellar hook-basal body complex protein [Duganella sp. BJB488]|uniref:flagellar hook protein FlgE n=1 Tax=unclassified Duganella TaxID=2636909 RepID=UPI000E34CBCB|nr:MULTISPECIES: flagellar hook-basal body complex protein [unclassified Duganella]RFP08761.1 flagellar hook-basal body complex protein [Duganella sp. BJB489]RFP18177.1 flagellar hook-basal body complex protein [Duganella sp. BJB488]RFP37938.1 flagellar hook-basal body complex protein [Duganella sp. BJB480]